jgi:hypothetical protein
MEFMAGEHRQDLRQEAEQMRLIEAAGLQQPSYWEMVKTAVDWLGSHLVRWGSKLQDYGTVPSPAGVSTEATVGGYSQN